MSATHLSTAQLEGNLRRFILFRLLYSARFYYPVFTVLFLDYGLTLEQFSILNMVWAISIVVAEVPSGALADVIGRKQLVVYAAALMVVEMALIAFAPIGASSLLFLLFLGNRLCSGLSEAAASGADEALAYDSLKALGREDEWSQFLERTTYVVSIGFFTTMILGAFAYDPSIVNSLLGFFNADWTLDESVVIRLPVILTLITACIVLVTTLGMHDPNPPEKNGDSEGLEVLVEPFRQIMAAGRWTLGHRFVLFVILAAFALDSVGRQFVVLASEYYRIIDIPVSWFGFVGAGMSLLGIINARFSRYLVTHRSPIFNFLVLSVILMLGLIGISFAIPWYGVLFAAGAFAMMGMVQYQASFYINREVDSKIRATVLSFKGLALNLGLGLASLFYTALVAMLKEAESGNYSEEELEQVVFVDSLAAFPVYYLLLFVVLVVAARFSIADCDIFFKRPNPKKQKKLAQEQDSAAP
ncbi:MAG: MFS transporter [Gammaproteobacteria bacterium]